MAEFDRNAPATKGDLADLEERMTQRMTESIRGAEVRTTEAIHAAEERSTEAMRDMQTEMLKAFYSFAEANQKRLTAAEVDSSLLKERVALLESRLTEVEKRLNLPPAA